MTNEEKEKAREIGNSYARQYRHNSNLYGEEFVFSNEECMQSALEMLKWKDQQVKKYLEKKRDIEYELSVANVDDPKLWHRHDGKWKMLVKIINELFGEEK